MLPDWCSSACVYRYPLFLWLDFCCLAPVKLLSTFNTFHWISASRFFSAGFLLCSSRIYLVSGSFQLDLSFFLSAASLPRICLSKQPLAYIFRYQLSQFPWLPWYFIGSCSIGYLEASGVMSVRLCGTN